MVVKHKIEMDLAKPARMPRVDTVHKDQYTRKLVLHLLEDSKPWIIPENVNVLVSFIRSDGTGGSYDTLPSGKQAWSAEGNDLTVELVPDILAVPGAAMMAVDLLQGSSKVSTFTIMLYVRKTIFTRVGGLEEYIRINGFLPMPDTAQEGQYFRVVEVDENGGVVKLETVDLPSVEEAVEAALKQAKESGTFDGASAYDAAVESGYTGTEEQWGKVMKQLANGVWSSVSAQAVHLTRSLTTDGGITVNFNGCKLRGVSNPKDDKDAANKRYVDALAAPYAVPSYWQNAVDTAIGKIREKHNQGGRGCLSFAWFSDCHGTDPGNTGKIVSAIMDACHVPFAMMCGDSIDGESGSAEDGFSQVSDMLKPIGWSGLLQTQGEEDTFLPSGVKIDTNLLYNAIYRKQAGDSRRIFGEDGTYFYMDDPVGKLRYVMLNGYQSDVSTSKTSYGFGAQQLSWLQNTALNVPDSGWAVVIGCHVPPNDTYLQNKTQLQEILGDFQNSGAGEIIGYFCGKEHKDRIDTTSFSYPVVCITGSSGASEDDSQEAGIPGTDTEHAVDFVTINRNSRTVYLTRLGAGNDRSFSY